MPHPEPANAAVHVSAGAMLGRLLFEPSATLVGAAQRRKARLLSILQFTHIWIFAATGLAMRLAESGALQTRGALTMACASVGTLGSYALSRTRHVILAGWWYILLNIAVGPALIVLCPPESGAAFIKIAFLLVSIMLTNVLASARTTLICSAVGLASTLYALLASGAPPLAEELRPAIIFFLTNVALIVVFGLHRDGIEADRSAELRARNAELEALRLTLEERIIARTSELSSRNSQMRLVLDNVAEGLFTIDRSGVISPEHSAALATWFGPLAGARKFCDYFGRCSAEFGKHLEFRWQEVIDDILPLELTLAQMPSLFEYGGRHFRFSFEPISEASSELFLVVVSDVSAEFEREAMQREKTETLAIFEQVLADRAGFSAFVEEGSQLLARILSRTTAREDFARAVHTLKGNALFFGLETVADACHEIESRLAEGGAQLDTPALASLEKRWAQITASVEHLVGERRDVIDISPQQHAALEQAVREQPPARLLRMIQDLKLEPVERRLEQFADQAQQIAVRLAKQARVNVSHDGLRLDRRRWAPLWSAFVHAVRNAMDHGVEFPAERTAAGKPLLGTLALRAQNDGENIWIELEDDGRGIDWEAVRRRCLERGLLAETHDDLVAALFNGGISTAAEVTDLSGRGVGMGALHSAVLDLGGRLALESRLGHGTRLQLIFPSSATPQ